NNIHVDLTGRLEHHILEGGNGCVLDDGDLCLSGPGKIDVNIVAEFREVHLNRTLHLTSLAYFSAFEVLPEKLILKHGETAHLTSRVFDHDLNEVTGSVEPNWTVASGPGELRNVLGGDNYFTAVEPGNGAILVSVEYYNERLEKRVPYSIRPVLKNADLGKQFQTYIIGTAKSIDALVLDSAGNDITSECNASWELFGPGSLAPGPHPLNIIYSPEEAGFGRIKISVDWSGDTLSREINFEVVHNLSRVEIIGVPDLFSPVTEHVLYAAVYSMEGEEITDYCKFQWALEEDFAEITYTSGDRLELSVSEEGQGNITVTASYLNRNVTCIKMMISRHPLQRVETDPDRVTMFKGDVISIHIRVFNTADHMINDDVSHIWSYDDTTLSRVSSNSTYLVLRAESVGIQLVTFKVSYFGASLDRELEVEVLARPELKRVEIRGAVADVKVGDTVELELFLFDGNGEPFLQPFEAEWSVSTVSLNTTSGTVVHFEALSKGEVVVDVQVVSEFGSAQSTLTLNVLEVEEDEGGSGVLWLIVILALIVVLSVASVFGYLHIRKRSKDVEEETPSRGAPQTDLSDNAPLENGAVPDQDLVIASEEVVPPY
ncbi:MAG: hypothetical protein U9R75_12620, partial [Candidatus Thermoplasmatota archaeon]|nr:hypothetical protein [Candidatus Thermoplasmatota archaeon]